MSSNFLNHQTAMCHYQLEEKGMMNHFHDEFKDLSMMNLDRDLYLK